MMIENTGIFAAALPGAGIVTVIGNTMQTARYFIGDSGGFRG